MATLPGDDPAPDKLTPEMDDDGSAEAELTEFAKQLEIQKQSEKGLLDACRAAVLIISPSINHRREVTQRSFSIKRATHIIAEAIGFYGSQEQPVCFKHYRFPGGTENYELGNMCELINQIQLLNAINTNIFSRKYSTTWVDKVYEQDTQLPYHMLSTKPTLFDATEEYLIAAFPDANYYQINYQKQVKSKAAKRKQKQQKQPKTPTVQPKTPKTPRYRKKETRNTPNSTNLAVSEIKLIF